MTSMECQRNIGDGSIVTAKQWNCSGAKLKSQHQHNPINVLKHHEYCPKVDHYQAQIDELDWSQTSWVVFSGKWGCFL